MYLNETIFCLFMESVRENVILPVEPSQHISLLQEPEISFFIHAVFFPVKRGDYITHSTSDSLVEDLKRAMLIIPNEASGC